MECFGTSRIFHSSTKICGLKYTEYYGNGDSKGFLSVMEKIDEVLKLECTDYIQKETTRVDSCLQNLKSKTKVYIYKRKIDRFLYQETSELPC